MYRREAIGKGLAALSGAFLSSYLPQSSLLSQGPELSAESELVNKTIAEWSKISAEGKMPNWSKSSSPGGYDVIQLTPTITVGMRYVDEVYNLLVIELLGPYSPQNQKPEPTARKIFTRGMDIKPLDETILLFLDSKESSTLGDPADESSYKLIKEVMFGGKALLVEVGDRIKVVDPLSVRHIDLLDLIYKDWMARVGKG